MRRPVSSPQRVSGCRLAVKRFALGPSGRPMGDGAAEHPLGGGCVGPGYPTVWGPSPGHAVGERGGGPGRMGGRSCQQRHTTRHHARPRVRVARGWSWPSAIALAQWACAHGCQWRVESASVQDTSRRRALHAQRKQATLRLPDSTGTGAWPASPASTSRLRALISAPPARPWGALRSFATSLAGA
jgi:hypothetical protein